MVNSKYLLAFIGLRKRAMERFGRWFRGSTSWTHHERIERPLPKGTVWIHEERFKGKS